MKVAIRADAYPEIGTGHLMRCLALAQALRDGGDEVYLVSHCPRESLLGRFRDEGVGIRSLPSPGDRRQTVETVEQIGAAAAVLDGYPFAADFHRALRACGSRLLVLDDYAHLDDYDADLVLNQNYGAEKLGYPGGMKAELLAGSRYVLLRREFSGRPGKEASTAGPPRILVTLGGADSQKATRDMMRGLARVPRDLSVRVVIGAENPHRRAILDEGDRSPGRFECLTDVRDMAGLMEWADCALSAGGTTLWELACLGVPTVAVVAADNQRPAVIALTEAGRIRSAGDLDEGAGDRAANLLCGLLDDREEWRRLSEAGRALVDGKGAGRVAARLRALAAAP